MYDVIIQLATKRYDLNMKINEITRKIPELKKEFDIKTRTGFGITTFTETVDVKLLEVDDYQIIARKMVEDSWNSWAADLDFQWHGYINVGYRKKGDEKFEWTNSKKILTRGSRFRDDLKAQQYNQVSAEYLGNDNLQVAWMNEWGDTYMDQIIKIGGG